MACNMTQIRTAPPLRTLPSLGGVPSPRRGPGEGLPGAPGLGDGDSGGSHQGRPPLRCWDHTLPGLLPAPQQALSCGLKSWALVGEARRARRGLGRPWVDGDLAQQGEGCGEGAERWRAGGGEESVCPARAWVWPGSGRWGLGLARTSRAGEAGAGEGEDRPSGPRGGRPRRDSTGFHQKLHGTCLEPWALEPGRHASGSAPCPCCRGGQGGQGGLRPETDPVSSALVSLWERIQTRGST